MPKRPKAPDLLKSWEVVSNYNGLPQLHSDRISLIRLYYGNSIHGRPLESMPEKQIYSLALSTYNRSSRFIQGLNLTPDEKALLTSLTAYQRTLEKKESSVPLTRTALGIEGVCAIDAQLEGLEERIAIQIADADIPENSLVVSTYERIRPK